MTLIESKTKTPLEGIFEIHTELDKHYAEKEIPFKEYLKLKEKEIRARTKEIVKEYLNED